MARSPRPGGMRSDTARQRRLQVREAQRPVRARLEAADAEILGSVDTVANAFLVRISDEKAAALASIPGVLRVHRVRMFKPVLDRALPLHHVPRSLAASRHRQRRRRHEDRDHRHWHRRRSPRLPGSLPCRLSTDSLAPTPTPIWPSRIGKSSSPEVTPTCSPLVIPTPLPAITLATVQPPRWPPRVCRTPDRWP